MRRLTMRSIAGPAALCALIAASMPPALAGRKPLWEAGFGVGAISFPDYPGSRNQSSYVVPVPYFIYRGRILRADRNGLQARLLDTSRFDSYLSLGASPPVRSGNGGERGGMPDIRPTVGFGPALEAHLWRSSLQRMRLDLRLPVREVFSAPSRPRQVGWQFTPVLNLDVAGPAGLPGWNLGLQAGPVFSDRRYNSAFYGVAPAYATPDRPAYVARGGFSGSQFTVALSRRFPRFWVGAFARVDDLHGAVIADSPLVGRSTNLSLGIGIAWILGESDRMVRSND